MPILAGEFINADEVADVAEDTLYSLELGTAGSLHTGISTSETNITKLDKSSVTVEAGVLYGWDVELVLQNSNGSDGFQIRIRKGLALTGTLVGTIGIYPPGSTSGHTARGWAHWPCGATETTSFHFSIVRVAGSGTVSVYGTTSIGSSRVRMVRAGSASKYTLVP